MLIQFFLPYLTLCHVASWGLAQNLEGVGLFTYLNSQPMQVGDAIFYPMNLNPRLGVANLAVCLTGVLVVVFSLNIRACFYLSKWVGCAGLILWTLPGMLNMLGYMPEFRFLGPDVFRFGIGFPGTVESAAANLFICLVGGWSFILLLSSLWKKNTFKNAYDHVWYTLGLIAALYFVVDAGLSSYKEDLAEVDGRMVRTLQLFDAAQNRLEVLCARPETEELSPKLCALAPELRRGVSNYLDMKDVVRAKIEPPAWVAKLVSDPVLEHQIAALNNWACAQGQQLVQCKKIPFDTALSTSDADTSLVFPPPRYAEAMQQFHASMEKSDRRIRDIERGHNLRYFGFLVVAILAGGKLANASRAMVKDDSVRPTSWVLITIWFVGKKAMASLKCLVALVTRVCRFLIQGAVFPLVHYQEAKALSLERRKKAASEPG